MIYYFSGTGNSKFVAEKLAERLNEELRFIPDLLNAEPLQIELKLKEGERLGFVFPIHAWGPPAMVIEYIEKIQRTDTTDPYCYAVCTCGEDTGKAMTVLRQALGFKGIPLHATYSIQMPNNYVLGYPVDDPVRIQDLIVSADARLEEIIPQIIAQKSPVSDCHEGKWAKLRTRVIHSLFIKHAIRPDKFYATDQCTSCGKCEQVCITQNIQMVETELGLRPKWGKNCTFCLACINHCPVEAIQHGKTTDGRGRYYFHR